MNGFFKFVVRGNVIGLAVGVVIGGAFAALVTSFVGAFLTPLIGVATSNVGDYSNQSFSIGKNVFPYGHFINGAIAFLLTAAAIYFLVVVPVNKVVEEFNPHHDLSKAKRSCPECLQTIPAQARRCSFCTSHVEPILDADDGKFTEEVPGEISLSGGVPAIKMPEAEAAKAE